ncbi:MAG: hypothetical protein JOZ46_12540 [Candidatus Dormibacteraeota bacterium]|nr:hypothetical protein [Candidatus Dormibacteraeota bacterium]MBV9526629.1 hypothetical protein [Candidatus Dormibacteraeota bacterium]
MAASDRGLVARLGPLEVDWPRSVGYFGGAALAVGLGIIEAPLGVAIAAVPFVRMLADPRAPRRSRAIGQVFEGAMKPIGSDGEGTVRLSPAAPLPKTVRKGVTR